MTAPPNILHGRKEGIRTSDNLATNPPSLSKRTTKLTCLQSKMPYTLKVYGILLILLDWSDNTVSL